jgi:signal transduction histidine kinase
MTRPSRHTRGLQLGFLALLVFSTAQVVWWVYDQTQLARRERENLERLYETEAQLAGRLLAEGRKWDEISRLLPDLALEDGRVVPSSAAVEAIADEQARRLRRYGAEGTFFLLVLVACMAVMWRTLREESELRRRQENFVAAVTHEFKSPLASLQLAAETIELRRPDPERLAELVARMRAGIVRLENMGSKILDSASLDAGRLRLTKEPIGLAAVAASVAAEIAERAREAKVGLEVEIPGELEIAADPVATRTVLRNLLENALRATAATGAGSIRVSAAPEGGHVLLRVADTGVGFEAAEATRLFEKFYRVGDELTRTGKGTGLGLYIVDRFMRLEQGWVAAESPGPGRGATFTVAWPKPDPEGKR